MPRRLVPVLSLVSLLLLVSASLAEAQEEVGFIRGIVTDSVDGKPIEGAIVLLKGTLLRATTSATGSFQLFPAPPGPQAVTIVAIGYRSVTVAATVTPGGVDTLSVALGKPAVEIPGIVVTASRGEEEQRESPVSVAVITNRELVQRNVTTIAEALPFVPGVTFNNSDISIRGSTGVANGVGSRVLLLLDGHPILTGDGGEVDFEAIPLLDVERVEIVKGAYSALYGSNALGGVVNMITSPISERSATLVRARFGFYQVPSRYKFTSDHLTAQGLEVQHSQRVGGVGLRLLAGRETSDGFTDNNASRRWLFRLKATGPEGSGHPWDTYAIYAREVDYDFFSWLSASSPFTLDTVTTTVDSLGNTVRANAVGDREVANKVLTGASFTPLVRTRTVLRISPYLNYNTLRNVFQNSTDYHNAFKVGGTATLTVTPRSEQSLILGADGGHTVVTSNFLGSRELDDGGLFGQYDVRLAEPIKLVVGSRLDYHKAAASEQELSLSPKLGLVATASEHLAIRASVGRGYRAPSGIEQFVNTIQFGFHVVPNPALKGEHAWAGELGFTATSGRVWADASVFQSNYRGLIGPGPVKNRPGYYQFQNIDRARVRGFDGGVRLRVLRNLLDLQASYLYLDTRDIDLSNFAHRNVALFYRSRHTVTGSGELLGGLLGVDLRFRSRPEEVLQFPNDPRSSITVVDLRLGCRLLGAGLQFKVSNLFQSSYTNVQERTPGAPRNFSLTVYRGF